MEKTMKAKTAYGLKHHFI